MEGVYGSGASLGSGHDGVLNRLAGLVDGTFGG